MHVAIDDASRLAYVEVLGDEGGVTTTTQAVHAPGLALIRAAGASVRQFRVRVVSARDLDHPCARDDDVVQSRLERRRINVVRLPLSPACLSRRFERLEVAVHFYFQVTARAHHEDCLARLRVRNQKLLANLDARFRRDDDYELFSATIVSSPWAPGPFSLRSNRNAKTSPTSPRQENITMLAV